jgi:hypothetical protein
VGKTRVSKCNTVFGKKRQSMEKIFSRFPAFFNVRSFYRRAGLSGLIIDSQSVKTTSNNEKRGYDGRKAKTLHNSRYNGQFAICNGTFTDKLASCYILLSIFLQK